MLKTRKTIAIISILIFLLSSCAEAAKTEVSNKQWLQNLACTFPCWQGITPNETNFEDVMPILRDAKVEFRSATEDEIEFTFEEDIYGSVHKASNSAVDYVTLNVPYEKLTLGDLEPLIGIPQKVLLAYGGFTSDCQAYLLYPDSSIIIDTAFLKNHSWTKDWLDCQVDLTADSEIFRIVLLSKNLDDSELWKQAYPSFRYSREKSETGYLEWKGYGRYP